MQNGAGWSIFSLINQCSYNSLKGVIVITPLCFQSFTFVKILFTMMKLPFINRIFLRTDRR